MHSEGLDLLLSRKKQQTKVKCVNSPSNRIHISIQNQQPKNDVKQTLWKIQKSNQVSDSKHEHFSKEYEKQICFQIDQNQLCQDLQTDLSSETAHKYLRFTFQFNKTQYNIT